MRISAEARGKTISRGENDTTPQDYPMIRGDEDSLVWAALTTRHSARDLRAAVNRRKTGEVRLAVLRG